jgi:hypothetical protein
LPALKSFFKDGEAEWYHNVTVEFVHGHHPVLYTTIIKQRRPSLVYLKKEEQISLLPYAKSKTALHNLFQEKGFSLMEDEDDRRAASLYAWQRDYEYQAAGARRRVLRQIYFDDEQYYVKRFQQDIMSRTQHGRYWLSFQSNTCPYGSSRPMLDYTYDNYKRLHAVLYHERTGDNPPPPLQTSTAFKIKYGLPLQHSDDGSPTSDLKNRTLTKETKPKVVVQRAPRPPIVLQGETRRWQRKLFLDDERYHVFAFQEHIMQIQQTFLEYCYSADEHHPLDFVFDTYRHGRLQRILRYESLFVFGHQNKHNNNNNNNNTTTEK